MTRTFQTALLVSVLAHVVAFAVATCLPSRQATRDPSALEIIPVVQVSFLADDPSPPPAASVVAAAVELPKPPVETPPKPEPPKGIPPPPVVEKPKPAPPVEPKPVLPEAPLIPVVAAPVVAPVIAVATPRPVSVEPTRPSTVPGVPSPALSVPDPSARPSTTPAVVGETVRVRGIPSYRKRFEPVYPALARKRRQEGVVLLRVQLDAAGYVESAVIAQSSGFTLLDDAARAAVRNWEFEAARLNNRPVSSEVEVPVRFELRP